jgi:hypothetical protein
MLNVYFIEAAQMSGFFCLKYLNIGGVNLFCTIFAQNI